MVTITADVTFIDNTGAEYSTGVTVNNAITCDINKEVTEKTIAVYRLASAAQIIDIRNTGLKTEY